MPLSLRAIRPVSLRLIDIERVNTQARAGMREYLEEVKKIMQDNYNTAQVSPAYTRTRKLRRGWRVIVRSNNFGDLINVERYAGFVQGPNRPSVDFRVRQQSRMRKRGWRSISDVARETKRKYALIMNRRIRSTAVKGIR